MHGKQNMQKQEIKRDKCLITMETKEDLDLTFNGFMSLVKVAVTNLKTEIVVSNATLLKIFVSRDHVIMEQIPTQIIMSIEQGLTVLS